MAETGVGPSMASGSQTCSGNWADLPTVPMKSSRPMAPATDTDDSMGYSAGRAASSGKAGVCRLCRTSALNRMSR